MDFTLKTYTLLIKTLQNGGYGFQTFVDFIQKPKARSIILRHDVDRLPENALVMARIEKELGIKSTYFFRTIKSVFNPDIIGEIADMGHEIGYHYENLVAVSRQHSAFSKKKIEEIRQDIGTGVSQPGFQEQNQNDRNEKKSEGSEQKLGVRSQDVGSGILGLGFGKKKAECRKLEAESLYELALEDFKQNLERLRKLYPVKTICMHGSPLSKYDSRDLWNVYDYRDFGIIGEPYFDVDFDKVLYLTDTGRRWDGERFNIRDKISFQHSAFSCQQTKGIGIWGLGFGKSKGREARGQKVEDRRENKDEKNKINKTNNHLQHSFHSTFDIIKAAEEGRLPDKMMINIHPQRWTNKPLPWVKELIWQNVKNVIKRFLIKRNDW